ncbi:MAG TPA: right-handed parallel beta-helix repeat-containing protein [bacterium]|nr:right-handed parallel beta-helix repeat-containing protein [bacterium]
MDRRIFLGSTFGLASCAALPGITEARNVCDLGVSGKGDTDDTDTIQQAVNSGVGGLYFPRGGYRLSKTVVIDLALCGRTSIIGDGTAHIEMAGPGPAFHVIGTHETIAAPHRISDTVWEKERMPIFSGVEIRGSNPDAVGLRLEKTFQPILTNLLIRRCKTAVHLIKWNRNAIISNCHIMDNKEYGISFDHVDCHQVIISHNLITFNTLAGIHILGGLVRNLQIVGNDIEYNHDMAKEGCSDILVDSDSENQPVFLEGTIVGNTIQAVPSPGGSCIRVIGGEGLYMNGLLTISNNLIGNRVDGIHLANCRGVSITGNSLYDFREHSVQLDNCQNVSITGNNLDWLPSTYEKSTGDRIRVNNCRAISLNGTIMENSVHGDKDFDAAIQIDKSEDVSITDCQIFDPSHQGIAIRDSKRCRISNSTILDRRAERKMTAAVRFIGTNRDIFITGNTINKNTLSLPDESSVIAGNNMEVEPNL